MKSTFRIMLTGREGAFPVYVRTRKATNAVRVFNRALRSMRRNGGSRMVAHSYDIIGNDNTKARRMNRHGSTLGIKKLRSL